MSQIPIGWLIEGFEQPPEKQQVSMMITKRTLLTPILMIDNFMFPTEKIVGDI